MAMIRIPAPHRPSRHGMIAEAIASGTGRQAIVLCHHRLTEENPMAAMAIPTGCRKTPIQGGKVLTLGMVNHQFLLYVFDIY